jgi:hypothetical protein
VQLCPWATINISDIITCSSVNQELSTFTYPTGSQRATIVVTGVNQSAAIVGNLCACVCMCMCMCA